MGHGLCQRSSESSKELLFSCSVMSDSLQPHRLQHARLPCPSPSPGACSNSSLSHWCHTTISSSVTPFSSGRQSFPASRSLPMSWLFTSGGQSIGVSASASVLPMNIQDWFPLGLTGWISMQPKGLSRVFSMWEKARVEWFERTALKHVYYHMWNRSPVQVRCMRQGAQGWCTGMTLRDGMGREVGAGSRMGNTCTPITDSCQCMDKTTTIL